MSPPSSAQVKWLLRVLGVDVTGQDAVATPDDAHQLRERLDIMRAALSVLAKAADPAARELGALFVSANKATDAKAPNAVELVDQLETAMARASGAARTREAAGASAVTVDFRKILLDWHKAQGLVEDNLLALGDAFLELEEVRADPRYDDVADAVDSLTQLIPGFGSKLDDDLNAYLNSGGRDAKAIEAARQTLQQYRKQLADAPELKDLEVFGKQDVGGDFPLHSALTEAMDQMQLALDQAA